MESNKLIDIILLFSNIGDQIIESQVELYSNKFLKSVYSEIVTNSNILSLFEERSMDYNHFFRKQMENIFDKHTEKFHLNKMRSKIHHFLVIDEFLEKINNLKLTPQTKNG